MSTFTLAISCLTTSNLPWFMDLTFQVPMQYCYLQHWTLILSPVTFTTGCCFCFGSISSFFLEVFLDWSPVTYWAPTDLGSSSSSVLNFWLFILFMEFSRQECWSGFEVVSHSLLQWTMFGWTEDAERTREQSSWVTWPCICTNAQHVLLVALRGACVNSRILYELYKDLVQTFMNKYELCEEGWMASEAEAWWQREPSWGDGFRISWNILDMLESVL